MKRVTVALNFFYAVKGQEDEEEDVGSYWMTKEWLGYSHLKEEALDRTVWRAGFGRGFGPVVRQTAKWMYG
jgi:hypothetical protein